MVMNKLGCVCIRDAWCFRVGTKKMWHGSKCFLQKVLYVHVCMRKIGRTTRYAKLPEGTATSSMIFLMVYRLRFSQKNADAPRWKWKLLGQVKWLSVAGLVPARRQSALQGWSNVTYDIWAPNCSRHFQRAANQGFDSSAWLLHPGSTAESTH